MQEDRNEMLIKRQFYLDNSVIISDMMPDMKVKMTPSDFCVFLMVTGQPKFYVKKHEHDFMELVQMVKHVNELIPLKCSFLVIHLDEFDDLDKQREILE